METSLPDAVARMGQIGALEILVEAGPTLLDAVLSSELWDEHCTIRQSAGPTGADRIDIRLRAEIGLLPPREEKHVFRNH